MVGARTHLASLMVFLRRRSCLKNRSCSYSPLGLELCKADAVRRTGFPACGRASARLWSAPGTPFTPAPFESLIVSACTITAPALSGGGSCGTPDGIPRLRAGLGAALECPRHSIHSRAVRIPPCFGIYHSSPRPFGRGLLWYAGRDSNPRPLAPEANTLSS